MTETILDKIIADKRITVAGLKKLKPEEAFLADLKPSDRDFYRALRQRSPAYLLECKKGSPSCGLIREDFNLNTIAAVYGRWTDVVSVLTDRKYFQGDMRHLRQVRDQINQPVLCKDFIVCPYQIRLARYYGADAVLLMLSVLNNDEYKTLTQVAQGLNMGILTEVSNSDELERAIALNAKVIGINNRDLRDFSINPDRSRQLAPTIPTDRIVIAESGISTHAQVRAFSQFVDGFLVGSALMSQRDVHRAVADLLLGINKLCGLTRKEDVAAAYQAGIHYGGLIFSEKSPRRVDFEQARILVSSAPLQWVGVFADEAIQKIADYASKLKLSTVQLHGHESPRYIAELKTVLPQSIQIWKAHSVSRQLPDFSQWEVDKHLLDTQVGHQSGGTGRSFDWQLLRQRDLSRVILAGGLNPDNAAAAASLGCAGLDFNSGLETAPGIKSLTAIQRAMQALRTF